MANCILVAADDSDNRCIVVKILTLEADDGRPPWRSRAGSVPT